MHALRRLGHLIGQEWKLLIALVLIWYAALVIGNQLIADHHQATQAVPPKTEPSAASAVYWSGHGGTDRG
jgi:hypothetical protein